MSQELLQSFRSLSPNDWKRKLIEYFATNKDDPSYGKYQKVHTPFALCNEIVNELKNNVDLHSLSILVFNIEWIVVLIEDFGVSAHSIAFVADSETKARLAQELYNIKKVLRVSYDSTKKKGERISIMPKPKKLFDCIIMNPPYKGAGKGLHLQFLELGMELATDGGHVTCVHPATWIICKKPNPHYQEARDLVKGSILDLTIFNPNQVFVGTEMGYPCVITNLCKGKGGRKIKVRDNTRNEKWEYNSIDDINVFGNYPEYHSLRKKISTFIQEHGSINDHVGDRGGFYVNLPKITGHLDTSKIPKSLYRDDFFTLCNRNTSVSRSPTQQPVGFRTRRESENFLAYARCKFARFCVSFFKFNKNNHRGELKFVPWLDFAQSWDSNHLKEVLGILTKEWKFIEKIMPDWYGGSSD